MTTETTPPPFDDSRRLTGPNLYFAEPGAVLETEIGTPVAPALIDAWTQRIGRARAALGWPETSIVVREHASGASLAFTAPADLLYTATEVNEWAWLSALADAGIDTGEPALQPGHAPLGDDDESLRILRAAAAAERLPALRALREGALAHGLPLLLDDEQLSIGTGTGSLTWDNHALPQPGDVPWDRLHAIPVALVTGSNGKTTTVRLLTAIAIAHGWHTANSCTDGIYLDGALIEGGDYSGPGGARSLLRNRQAQAAILETARGGLLRRGLGIDRADVALVTNVSPDHFGEYGIHDLDGLAQVKLTVARAVGADGVLVLNADNAPLRRHATDVDTPLAWFSVDDDHPLLQQARAEGRRSCGVRDGRLWLFDGTAAHDLGAIADMPLTLGGLAAHNVQNCAAAALTAACLGVEAGTIGSVLARFGSAHGDNPGRLQRWTLGGGVQVYVDYAHNPDGLQHLLGLVRQAHREGGRLHLLLGQAGDRSDDAIADLAATAAANHPDRVVLKDMDGYLRGRESGAVARLLREALVRHGVADDAIVECLDETEAARRILGDAGPGDSLVLPVHGAAGRGQVTALLDRLQEQGWAAGDPVPGTGNPG
ncbi:Mur ligase family protein [Luteimonas terricola]|uniref:Mur ligase n=1 Tax=Luteimonas terricola TaxID=645597 RepID=A0ABQ2EJC4_9GAMM|nr:Mur ligase family protein [Luteimonas terricola]GGK14339.1 Mur ligase [Luteimonas terricola]